MARGGAGLPPQSSGAGYTIMDMTGTLDRAAAAAATAAAGAAQPSQTCPANPVNIQRATLVVEILRIYNVYV